MRRYKFRNLIRSMAMGMFLLLTSYMPASAVSFTWTGYVDGEDPVLVSAQADFTISGSQLEIVLTNTTSETINALGLVLSILTWDIADAGVTLDALSAYIAPGSGLVGADAGLYPGVTDLSGEWAFKDDVSAGLLGTFGIGAVGDILNGADSFGTADMISSTTTLINTAPLTGPGSMDATIVGPNVDFTTSGFDNQGPLVQTAMVFTFDIYRDNSLYEGLTDAQIANVNPLFGTDGMALVPEPNIVMLLGLGMIGFLLVGRRIRGDV